MSIHIGDKEKSARESVDKLTEKQLMVYNYIHEYRLKNGYSPSIRDVGKKFNISVKASSDHICALKRKGYISNLDNKARSFVTLKEISWEDLSEDNRVVFRDKAANMLKDLYCCTRVWEAWNYGTMSQDDFISADVDDNIVEDTAMELYNISRGKI